MALSQKQALKIIGVCLGHIKAAWEAQKLVSPTVKNTVDHVSPEHVSKLYKGIVRTALGNIDTTGICIIEDGNLLQIVPRDVPKLIKKLEEKLLELSSPTTTTPQVEKTEFAAA